MLHICNYIVLLKLSPLESRVFVVRGGYFFIIHFYSMNVNSSCTIKIKKKISEHCKFDSNKKVIKMSGFYEFESNQD